MNQTLFDGPDITQADTARLSRQLERVLNQMSDGRWFTLSYLTLLVGGSEAGVSARIRDLRKPPLNLIVERRRVGGKGGLWEYRIVGGHAK